MMKPLKEAFINKNTIKNISTTCSNKFGLTKKDLIGALKGYPLGVVVRMLEEQELQGNRPDVTVFQNCRESDDIRGGFNWSVTEAAHNFWSNVLDGNFERFFRKYPEYKKYDK